MDFRELEVLPNGGYLTSSLLEVALRHRVGELRLNISLVLNAPWTVLFGASGSGKTTVLRMIAGFVQPEKGRVVLGGRTLVDTERGVCVRADRRGVRSAGQSPRLFAGMTVRENLLYGEAGSAVKDMEELFRLDGLMEKRPEALSGGERQRVSVARAVASAVSGGAGLLLLDEPFGGLDFAVRDALAAELRDWLATRGVPVLSVTHDVGEAFLLGAEVVRIAEGRVVAHGPAGEVLAAERERLVGQLRLSDESWPLRH